MANEGKKPGRRHLLKAEWLINLIIQKETLRKWHDERVRELETRSVIAWIGSERNGGSGLPKAATRNELNFNYFVVASSLQTGVIRWTQEWRRRAKKKEKKQRRLQIPGIPWGWCQDTEEGLKVQFQRALCVFSATEQRFHWMGARILRDQGLRMIRSLLGTSYNSGCVCSD